MQAEVKVGITAWSDPSLLASGWYPKEARTPEARLRFYASRFPIVENDGAHYAVPTREQAEAWVERTPPGFTMDVKAFATMSGHYTSARQLPVDVRAELPRAKRDARRLYPKDLPDALRAAVVARFRQAIEPLRASGRLGVVLVQYPPWFPCSPVCRAEVAALRGLLPDVRVAVEFRNRTWMSEKNRARTLATLRDHDLAYTCVDEPQGFFSSVPPVAEATSDVALVRFHGRNAGTWDGKATKTAAERFRHLYTTRELAEWVPRIDALAERAREVHVLMNNCFGDFAVRNAFDMTALLEREAGLRLRGVAAPPARTSPPVPSHRRRAAS